MDKISNGIIVIGYGEKQIFWQDNKVTMSKHNSRFKAKSKPSNDKGLFRHKPKIAIVDTEYIDNNGISKIYALGFITDLHAKPTTNYIDRNTLSSDNIVLSLIDELVRNMNRLLFIVII